MEMHGQDFRDINAIPSGWKLSAYSAVISSQLRQCHRSQGVLSQTGISRLGLQPQGEFPCSSMCSFSQLMITVVWGLGFGVGGLESYNFLRKGIMGNNDQRVAPRFQSSIPANVELAPALLQGLRIGRPWPSASQRMELSRPSPTAEDVASSRPTWTGGLCSARWSCH